MSTMSISQVDFNKLDKQMAVMQERFDNLERKLDEILKMLECLPDRYVTTERFKPYALAMNLVASTVILAIIGAVINLISQHKVL